MLAWRTFFSSLALPPALLILLAGCRTDVSGQYEYHIPGLFGDGIKVGSINETPLDTSLIFSVIKDIAEDKFDEVHSLLVYKDGKLVLEEYFEGHDYDWQGDNFWGPEFQWHRDSLHNIMSDTKSITSALIGIAIDKGFIINEKESIFTYLPGYKAYAIGSRKEITIEHLLTMTSGIEGNEWTSSYRNLENPIIKLWMCEDPIRYILENRMVAIPGTHFSYWGGNQILLGEILKNATGSDVENFAITHLFEPLGIDNYIWPRINDGPHDTAGGLELTPRAMMKIGMLYLNKGGWKGKQILSERWVEKSLTPFGNNLQINVPGRRSWRHGYTYSWWTKSFEDEEKEMFFAGGWGGQNIMIIPGDELVVVFTGGNYSSVPPPKKIMEKYIVRALN
ncbi:MAG: serine hydrolase [Flavobacteriaceae bacterium]